MSELVKPVFPKSCSEGIPKLVTTSMGWMAREKQMSEIARATSKMWADL